MNIIHGRPDRRNKNYTTNVTTDLFFEDIVHETGGKLGVHDIACPYCGPGRRAPANRRKKVMRVWHLEPGFASYHCARCGEKGFARDDKTPPPHPVVLRHFRAEAGEREGIDREKRLQQAKQLWSDRLPVQGTIAERYLREARGYGGMIPATLGFLPGRGEYPPAMIAAFGLAHEVAPGVIAIAENAIVGVHLTRLLPDGSDRDRGPKAKIMIGSSAGWPIVIAPPNDLLGLVITEGIEDALSAHEASGRGAWAVGCASRMPRLADVLPSYLDSVTVFADGDPDGVRNATALAHRITGIETRLVVPTLRAVA
jgi:DNA-directed RNA polymerase subunit RPC12/RpoP